MKRDLNLIRSLLLEMEKTPAGEEYYTLDSTISGTTIEILNSHLRLLEQAGFVSGVEPFGDGMACGGITWKGYEFLESCRSQSLWNKAMKSVNEKAASIPVSVLSELLTNLAKQSVGLQ